MEMMEQWDQEATKNSPITTEQLDQMVQEMNKARTFYNEKKAESNAAEKIKKEMEYKLMEALKQAGKKKYSVDGLGTISLIGKVRIPTLKTIEQKLQFEEWARGKGDDFFYETIGVNHNTLTSLYNTELETTGKTIPGCESPEDASYLRLTKEKSK